VSGLGYIAAEKPQQCDLCGKIAELRPYGPNGECVCFDCGMKDPKACAASTVKHLFGETIEGRDLDNLTDFIRSRSKRKDGAP
jgi:hypothetical protein